MAAKLKRYPAPEKFTKELLDELQVEYTELKELADEQTANQTKRFNALKTLGPKAAKFLKEQIAAAAEPEAGEDEDDKEEEPAPPVKAKRKAKAAPAADAPEPPPAFASIEEQRELFEEMVNVMALDCKAEDVADDDLEDKIKTECAPDEDDEGGLMPEDFLGGGDGDTFSEKATILFVRMGIALPEGVKDPTAKAKKEKAKAKAKARGTSGGTRDGSKHQLAETLLSSGAEDAEWITKFTALYPNEEEAFIAKRVKSYQSWARRNAKA